MANVTVQLNRADAFTPWGFRLQGGRDFATQLSVKKVTRGTPSENVLSAGDAILSINSYDASQLTHAQASQMIKNIGNDLQLTVQKGKIMSTGGMSSIKPRGPVKFSPSVANRL